MSKALEMSTKMVAPDRPCRSKTWGRREEKWMLCEIRRLGRKPVWLASIDAPSKGPNRLARIRARMR